MAPTPPHTPATPGYAWSLMRPVGRSFHYREARLFSPVAGGQILLAEPDSESVKPVIRVVRNWFAEFRK